jgi:hypothetical protein
MVPVLAAYCFNGVIIIIHTLSFPGAFAPSGVIGGGPRSHGDKNPPRGRYADAVGNQGIGDQPQDEPGMPEVIELRRGLRECRARSAETAAAAGAGRRVQIGA